VEEMVDGAVFGVGLEFDAGYGRVVDGSGWPDEEGRRRWRGDGL
jgi:hypothetical protein